jgi:hypothetical protein
MDRFVLRVTLDVSYEMNCTMRAFGCTSRVADPVRDLFDRSGFLATPGKDRVFFGEFIRR